MNIKHCSALLVALLCIPSTHAQDKQAHQSPFVRNLLAAKAPTSGFSQEEMDKLVALIRAIAQENNVKIEEDDLIFQAQLRLFCKQIHEQTGTLLTPTELFNNMNAACEDIGAWKLFCAEHGLEYITPMQLFEQFVATQQQSKNVELNKKLLLGVGLGIGGLGGVTAGVLYADSIKNMLTIGGIFALIQCAENHHQFTQKIPLTHTQRLGFNIVLDSLTHIGTYHMQSHQSANPKIIDTIRPLASNDSIDKDLRSALSHVVSEFDKKNLPPLRQDKKYDITQKDYVLLIAQSACQNLIDAIPVPEQDSPYLQIKNGAYTLLSQNVLLRATKESGKQCVKQTIETQLTSNRIKQENDPEKLATPNFKIISRIIAATTAKELGYSLIAQIAHKKVAPNMNEKTAVLLQTCFPDDGIPKNDIHELTRLATISAITLCAATGLNAARSAGTWALDRILDTSTGLLGA